MAQSISRRTALQGVGALAMTVVDEAQAAAEDGAMLKLRLIGTSDLHANVFSYDYFRDRPDDTVGLGKTATLIRQAMREAPNALLFDNGDIIQGTPFGDYAALAMGLKAGDVHPMIAAMNALPYEACTLGNHEFNYGLDKLAIALGGAKFPTVCANIFKPDGSPYYKPWIVLEKTFLDEAGAKQALRIGVIGFTPPQIVQWDQTNLNGRATTIGIAECASVEVPKLRAEGVDMVLALCHSGISRIPPPLPGEENAALALSRIPGVDVMFLGHQHLVLPGGDFAGIGGVDVRAAALNGVPAFMPGFWGSHMGLIDLTLERRDGAWRIVGGRSDVRPIYQRANGAVVALVEADAATLAAAQSAHDGTLAFVRAPVGAIDAPVNSFFAQIADDPSVRVVNDAQLWYVKKLVETTPALQGLPLLSAAAPFKAGGRGGPDYYTDVKTGPIAMKNIADLYLYPNTMRVVKVTGGQIREWLERSAGQFKTLDPQVQGEQALIDETFPAYNFDVIEGVTYAIDVTQPSRYDGDGKLVAPSSHRIRDLKLEGRPIDEAAKFLVVTNNYRASGGGNFPGCDGKTIVYEAPDTNRDAVVRYFQAMKTASPKVDGAWRLTPWPANVVATFLTSPAAASAQKPVGVTLTAIGPAEGGFAKYRVTPD
jgi:2',3'-cyclic-nucleotide 2'-phosphodiesterase/3'-nucleotidase